MKKEIAMYVGDFVFTLDCQCNLWMSNEDWECMQLSQETEEKLNELLKKFFEENI